MTVEHVLPEAIDLGGSKRIDPTAARRQEHSAREILRRFMGMPGVVLADEVGMGKTFVAFAVATGVMAATRGEDGPVVVVVPSHMLRKWQDDWQRFLQHCITDPGLKATLSARWATVDDVTGLLKLLDDPPERRRWLVFVKITAFTSDLKRRERWVKLALVQKAFARNPHLAGCRRAFELWASHLLEGLSKGLSTELVGDLLNTPTRRWRRMIDDADIESPPLDDDPVPEALSDAKQPGDLKLLYEFLRELPSSPYRVNDDRIPKERRRFVEAVQNAFKAVLPNAKWHTPLLILDEAHHLKNPSTRMHSLFQDSSNQGVDYLKGCFDRMLFLTATPFQLGHYELLSVLSLFLRIRWGHEGAPEGGEEKFKAMLHSLHESLNEAQRRARCLEATWAELTIERVTADLVLAGAHVPPLRDDLVGAWWSAVNQGHRSGLADRFAALVSRARERKADAENHLRPWLIRHNRERFFSEPDPTAGLRPRRLLHDGRAIEDVDVSLDRATAPAASGIDLRGDAMLPFLLSIRAQAELARAGDGGRAYFAEGLASSYEAFHHTRTHGSAAYDQDSDEQYQAAPTHDADIEAVQAWYTQRIRELVPAVTRDDPRARLHPKMVATVRRAVDLWEQGEKVLVFCFYIQTARALRLHISDEIEHRMVMRAATKLGLDPNDDSARKATWGTLERVTERCARPDSPFYRELKALVRERIVHVFGVQDLEWLPPLGQALHRFVRSFSYVARYFPLDNPRFAAAIQPDARADDDVLAVFRTSLEGFDGSGTNLVARVDAFLQFVKEKWEDQGGGERKEDSELDRYLAAFETMQFRSRAGFKAAEENFDEAGGRRVLANVRVVTGDGMNTGQRDVVMRAFNSPLFPEVLVASQVLAEGVDLHRCCRFVIHHDLYWNPSAIEQRNGRVDRIHSKSEMVGRPIHIFEPFLAATADEKMFRVVKDRERWFQVVMGDDFRLSEATTEKRLERLPLPASIAQALSFELATEQGDP
jgi:ERCC4-related helicase